MTTSELVRANELADELIGKMERITLLWAEIPPIDELQEILNATSSIAGRLDEIRKAYGAEDFPMAEEFEDLDTRLGGIVGSLNEIVEKQAEVDG